LRKAKNRTNAGPDIVTLFLLKALKSEGVDHIFLVPGYLVDYFLLHFKKTGIRPIIAAHEGGAAYMADGYARATKKFGVCMAIGGPGVTNMVTAIASAYGDRSPVLVIAGKINREYEAKGTFQDSSSSSGIDDVAIMRTVTEFAATVPAVDSAGLLLRKAMRAIYDVESLPVFLSVPMDIQVKGYQGEPYVALKKREHRVLDMEGAKYIAKDILGKATRIVIFAGNGTVRSDAHEQLEKFAQMFSIPVVTTLRAKGAISEDNEMSFGVFGYGGSLQANRVVAGSKKEKILGPEVILVLGATLNENNTFTGNMPMPKHLILLDINPNSNRDIEKYKPDFVMGDVRTFLNWMLEDTKYHGKLNRTKGKRQKWINKIKAKVPEPYEKIDDSKSKEIHPGRAILELRRVANEDPATRNSVIVADSGAHTFFSGHYWRSYAPNEFLVMTTMGPMGYGIAAGIGAKLSQKKLKKDKPVICIVGDGGMLMQGIELQTAVRSCVPLLVVVINNGALGNVYLRFANEYKDPDGIKLTKIEPRHDWDKFAESLGARATRVTRREMLKEEYRKAFRYIQEKQQPYLVDVVCDRECRTPNQELLPEQDRMRAFGIQVKKPYNPWFA
jgi:acetolactate synthase-1/2/3 large subunit